MRFVPCCNCITPSQYDDRAEKEKGWSKIHDICTKPLPTVCGKHVQVEKQPPLPPLVQCELHGNSMRLQECVFSAFLNIHLMPGVTVALRWHLLPTSWQRFRRKVNLNSTDLSFVGIPNFHKFSGQRVFSYESKNLSVATHLKTLQRALYFYIKTFSKLDRQATFSPQVTRKRQKKKINISSIF